MPTVCGRTPPGCGRNATMRKYATALTIRHIVILIILIIILINWK